MIDLELCYNRQLPNISSFIKEVAGIKRLVIKLLAKVIPAFKYRIYAVFWISKRFYRGTDKLGRIGQENIWLGNIYRDTSYIIIKDIENKELGARIIWPNKKNII